MDHDLYTRTTGRHLHVNGIALHCIEAGPEDGPLVILLHGFPEFWWGWRYQINPLAEAGFRVLVPDQRGYNLSDKPTGKAAYDLDALAKDVVGLADALGRETCCLVGHDWGGAVAWWAASRYPERVAKLVAINAPHPVVVGPYMRAHPRQAFKSLYIGFFQVPGIPETIFSMADYRVLKRSMILTSRSGTFSSADLNRYAEAWARPGALRAMLSWYRALPLAPQMPSGIRLSMPVLVMWGMRDRFVESGTAEASLALCERGTMRRFENATHWVHLEDANALNRELIGFLREA